MLRDTLRNGARLLGENQLELIVLLIPKKMRVMGPYVKFSQLTMRQLPEDWDLAPEETLAWHLKQLCGDLTDPVPFIDATPRLKERAAAGELVYLPFDSHLSSRGHAVVAELIIEALRGKL